jgi:predicted flap endonuclease-1-like 5' DNA nuclease
VAWFIGQSTLVIVLAFGLGLAVGWLLWARRMRLLTVEIVAARIRAAEQAASRAPYGRRITWTSSGRLALDAHTPLGGDNVRPRPPATSLDEMCHDVDEHHGGHRREPGVVDPAYGRDDHTGHGGPHIPAPRIEPSDIGDRDELDPDGFDADDDLDDDGSGLTIDDDFGTPFDPRFLPRLGHQRSTSDLRGLDRFRDLFTPTNGRTPETPEPRRTEPDLTPARDIDGGPSQHRRTGSKNADDTTLAAAGLAGDSAAGTATGDPGDPTPPSDAGSEFPESANMAAGAARPAETPSVDNRLAPAEAPAAPDTADDLTRIDGIGPKAAAALAAAGILTFDRLAAADGDMVATALRASGVRLTSSVHAWPLAAHRIAAHRIAARRTLECADDPGTAGGAPHTANGHDGHGADGRRADGRGPDGDGPDGDVNGRRGGLLPKRRSPGTPARRSIPPDALDPDDLARIEGIGPKFAAALVASGIRTFGQLANTDEMVLRKAIGNSRPDVAPSLSTWPTQARLLATGDEDGFAELTARLIAGRGLDDDLERIDGIGPQTSAALRAAGVRTFRALAASDGNRLRAAIENAGLRSTARLATWAAQARLLVDGDEEGFADLARRLVARSDEWQA